MSNSELYEYVLGLGDSALVMGEGLASWLGRAPALELDIAVTNLSLDLIGQAQLYLEYAAKVDGNGKTADDLAYLRDCLQYRNFLLVEQPHNCWGRTVALLFVYSVYLDLYLEKLGTSKDKQLADIANKASKEVAYHRRFASEWMLRLGDGTDESKSKVQKGLDDIWRFTGELFEMSAGEANLAQNGIAVDAALLEDDWNDALDEVLKKAGLTKPSSMQMISGRYQGHHGEHLGHMLSNMQFLQRSYPGASW